MERIRSALERVLFSSGEHRLRAGWRLALQAMLQAVLTLALGCGALLVIPSPLLSKQLHDTTSTWTLGAAELVEAVTVTVSVWMARRRLDRRSFASLGLFTSRHTAVDFVAGLCIAMVTMGFIFVAEWSVGWLEVTGTAWSAQPASDVLGNGLAFLGIFVLVGWSEELMSRGYHLQTLASGLSLRWGVILSSAVFGLLHLANPHATALSAAGILLAGLFLAYAYVRTGQLWLSIGLHVGWNLFEGVVFGFPVSGLEVYHLVTTRISGPILWTGGPFGPEAGLIVVPALVLGAALIHLYGRQYARSEALNTSRTF